MTFIYLQVAIHAFSLSLLVFKDISFHLLRHILENFQKRGPPHSAGVFPLEHLNRWISRQVKSRKNPDATVIETNRVCIFFPVFDYLCGVMTYGIFFAAVVWYKTLIL